MGIAFAFITGVVFGVIGNILYTKKANKESEPDNPAGSGSDGEITKQKQ